VDPITNQRIDHTQRSNGEAIEDMRDEVEVSDGLETVQDLPQETISGVPLSSSPIEEDGGLEAELRALEVTRRSGPPPAIGHPNPVPARLASLRSDTRMDDDVSDNPSFGIPGRFRTNSANSSASYSSSTHNVLSARMSPAEGPSRTSTQDQSVPSSRQMNGSLPADDGMGPLRQQIIMIQALEVPAEQKARMMHRLLTQGYSHAQEIHHAKHLPRPASPTSMISQERPATPASLSSFIWQINGSGDGENPGQQHIFRLSPDDLKRTYAPPDPPELDEDGVAINPKDEKEEVLVLGCKHYKRNVKLQCSTCDRWYTCRLCHDEVEDHVLIRKDTKNMLCMLCGSAQRAGECCVECGERTAWYYCNVCKLWDNDSNKSIYHCNDCGICRKGRGLGKDFFHCKVCSASNPDDSDANQDNRPVVPACLCPLNILTNASSGFPTAIVRSAEITCLHLHGLWSSCYVAIAFIRLVITST
jgi:uncharacterized CHY-type Zn-finger protein